MHESLPLVVDQPVATEQSDPVYTGIDITRRYLDGIGVYELLTKEDEFRLGTQVRAGVHVREQLAQEYRQPNPDEQLVLDQAEAARQEFICANLRLVVNIAKRYPLPTGVELLDLIQEGNGGLEHAVMLFRPELGFKFSTYATNWIKQSITRFLDSRARLVHVPHQRVEEMNSHREDVDNDEELDANSYMILQALHPTSLQTSIDNDGTSVLGDILPDVQAVDPEAVVAEKLEYSALYSALDQLDPLTSEVLRLRFGMDYSVERSFREIGKKLHVSPEIARRRYNTGLVALQHLLDGKVEIV